MKSEQDLTAPHVLSEDTIQKLMKEQGSTRDQVLKGMLSSSKMTDQLESEISAAKPSRSSPSGYSADSGYTGYHPPKPLSRFSQKQINPSGPIPKWKDISSTFDPMMSHEGYEKARQKYFEDWILPRLPRGEDLDEVYKEFQKRTQRDPLGSIAGQQVLKAKVAGLSALQELLGPTKPLMSEHGKDLMKRLETQQQYYERLAERDQIGLTLPKVAGTVAGGMIPFTVASALAEPLAGPIAAGMISNVRQATRLKKILTAGMAGAAIEAASADNNRFTAGLKGFGWGLSLEAGMSAGGYLWSKGLAKSEAAGAELAEKAIQEPAKVSQPVQIALAEKIKTEKAVSKSEVLPNSIVRNPKIRGVNVSLLPKEGTGVTTIEIQPGRESEALNRIRKAMDSGAEFNSLQFHPDYEDRAFKFLREARDSELWKYEDAMILEVKKGLSENIAKKALGEGIPASPISDSHVEIAAKRVGRDILPHEESAISEEAKNLAQDTVKDTAKEAGEEGPPTPPGVRFLGRQAMATPGEYTNMYSVKLAEGFEPDFTVRPGEKIEDKLRDVRSKWEGRFPTPKMTVERARQLVVQAGFDPEKSDLEAVRNMGEVELNRLLEVKGRAKSAGKEYDPLGQKETREAIDPDLIPEGETKEMTEARETRDAIPIFGPERKLEEIPTGDTFADSFRRAGHGLILSSRMKVTLHPFAAKVMVSDAVYQSLHPRAKATTYSSFRDLLGKLGETNLPGREYGMYPAILYTKNTSPGEMFHEYLHAAAIRGGYKNQFDTLIPRASRTHALAIAKALEREHYKGRPAMSLLDEVYAYASSAVEKSFTPYGKKWFSILTKWDGDETDLRDLVRGTSENILKASQGKLDDVSERILQRKLRGLIRKADVNLAFQVSSWGPSVRWNPERMNWKYRDGDKVFNLRTIDDVWDHFMKKDISDIAPSFSFGLESLGIRGPMMDVISTEGEPPLPSVGIQPEERWVGFSGASAWIKPLLSWVSGMDTKVNKALEKRGEAFPIFDKVKAVYDKVRDGDVKLQGWREDFVKATGKAGDKKLHDYFTVLTYSPKDLPEAAAKYNLTPTDLINVKNLQGWIQGFQDETGVPMWQWMRELYPRLNTYDFHPEAAWNAKYDPKSAGFWEKAVREGSLSNPRDTHLGRFAAWAMKQGFEKKFTGEALRELDKLTNYKVGEKGLEEYFLHGGLRAPLQNYINYVRGIPDQTSMVINRSMKDFVGKVQDKLKEINTHLPLGLKIPGSEANVSPYLMQRLMSLTYAAGLGLRPAVAVRDGLQVLSTSLPLLGARRFSRGMELMFSEKGRSIAKEAGAFLGKSNVGELYGDIMGEIPTEGRLAQGVNNLANKMMAPSRWGHNFARGITFLGEYDNALRRVKQLRSGEIDAGKFMRKTSLWFMPEQLSSKLLLESQGAESSVDAVARKIGLETVGLTQWPYVRGEQPMVLRTGLGRIFGQFGNWPLHYIDFLQRMYQKSSGEYRAEGLKMAGLWVASNFAASSGMEALGADVGKWFFLSPAGYSPSMHFDLVKDMFQAPEETDQGRQARKRVLEYPLNFVPARVELEHILKVMEDDPKIGAQTGALDPRILELLGFNPKKPLPDMTPEERARYELGFRRTPK